jgi:NADH-ubiquinone oxidoreductase chain 4
MPKFMVHLWLPVFHVEASVSGSIILAGVLLRLGGNGLIRVFPLLFKFGFVFRFL